MTDDPTDLDDLLTRARLGDEAALASLFDRHRDRLRRLDRLHLDRRLSGRVAPVDVVGEAYLDACHRFAEYDHRYAASMPLYLWFRLVTGQRRIDVHGHRLEARKRDADVRDRRPRVRRGRPLPHRRPVRPRGRRRRRRRLD